MTQGADWYKEQSEYNRRFYEWLHAAHPGDAHDWKVVALFYSSLHLVNYWFVVQTGRVPRNHFEKNRRTEGELPQVFDDYNDLYVMSRQARYCDGYRVEDARRKSADERWGRIDRELRS